MKTTRRLSVTALACACAECSNGCNCSIPCRAASRRERQRHGDDPEENHPPPCAPRGKVGKTSPAKKRGQGTRAAREKGACRFARGRPDSSARWAPGVFWCEVKGFLDLRLGSIGLAASAAVGLRRTCEVPRRSVRPAGRFLRKGLFQGPAAKPGLRRSLVRGRLGAGRPMGLPSMAFLSPWCGRVCLHATGNASGRSTAGVPG